MHRNACRFVAASKRYDAHLKATEPQEDDGETVGDRDGEGGGNGEARPNNGAQDDESPIGSSEDARVANTAEKRTAMATGQGKSSESSHRGGEGAREKVDDEGVGAGGASGDEQRRRQEELDLEQNQLHADVIGAITELRECMIFHDM